MTFGAAILVVASWMLLRPASAICRENCERIEVGMTLPDVENILGGPARDESSGTLLAADDDGVVSDDGVFTERLAELRAVFMRQTGVVPTIGPVVNYHCWVTNTAIVAVHLDNDAKVISKGFMPVYVKYEGPWAKLRRWLRL